MDPKKDVPELRPYQIAHLAFYIREKRCLDLSDPGTGKTPPACVYAQYLWQHERKRVVMTMPKSLLNKNRQEMLRFTQFEDHEVVVVDGTAKQRMKAIADPRHVVFLMGFQAFAKHWQDLAAAHGPGWAVIADEVHMGFGGSTSQRTADF
ncbi:MAG: DEAD/DEAH box helicase family protein [Paracoccaceae bacterium]